MPAFFTISPLREPAAMATITKGGSTDSDVNELAVNPCRTPCQIVVTTVTPLAQRRIPLRNSSDNGIKINYPFKAFQCTIKLDQS
jgi:hypothetical protein